MPPNARTRQHSASSQKGETEVGKAYGSEMVEDGPAAIRKPRLFLSLTAFLGYPLPCSLLQA